MSFKKNIKQPGRISLGGISRVTEPQLILGGNRVLVVQKTEKEKGAPGRKEVGARGDKTEDQRELCQ